MSAIAGRWNFDGNPEAGASCLRMLAAQEIYGPNGIAQWHDGAIAIGRCLYRTLPEDAFDRQPLRSADGQLTLVADVRLDNREELCPALGIVAGEAARMSDAAILLACLERWSENALDRLVGDFAFALWDSRAQRLLLARDFVGQRPLHYHQGKNFFAFSTMAKGLHALPDIPYAPDEQQMAEFVTLMPQGGSRSFFEGVAVVEAGHFAIVTRQGVVRRRYWDPAPPARSRKRGSNDYVEGLRHHLDQATRAMLRGAEGSVGSHLSGGYDSAAVTATAARLLAPEGGRITAFTAVPREGYEGPVPTGNIGDEGPLAAATAATYPNIDHVLMRSGMQSPLDELDRSFFLFERPVLNLCNSGWVCAINGEARERKLKVMLTGQMGNVSLSYDGLEFLPELLGSGRLIRLAREGARLVGSGRSLRSVAGRALGPYLPARLWQALAKARGRERNILEYSAIRPERLAELERVAKERALDFGYRPRKGGFESRLWIFRRFDLGNFAKGTLAGWGLDQRDPTADKRLVEYSLAVPTGEFLADGQTRSLARRALSDRLPGAVLDERRRGYQAADWHEGLSAARHDLNVELERLSQCGAAARTLDLPRLQGWLESLPVSGWERADVIGSYRFGLLRGLSAGHFLRKAAGDNN